jgi:hypothetical protein
MTGKGWEYKSACFALTAGKDAAGPKTTTGGLRGATTMSDRPATTGQTPSITALTLLIWAARRDRDRDDRSVATAEAAPPGLIREARRDRYDRFVCSALANFLRALIPVLTNRREPDDR